MAQSFSASIRDFASRTKAAQEDVLRSSVEDIMALASIAGVNWKERSGGPTIGAVPVDEGDLINTIASDLNGSGEFAIDAESDVSLTIEGMGAGDYLHVAWTAAYAHRINSGFVGTDSLGRTYEQAGAHWVEGAAEKWSDVVAANAEHLKP